MRLAPFGFWKNSGAASINIDDYTNPKLAFSLRRVSTAYTGFCIKIRRDTDNATLDIGFTGGLGSWVNDVAIQAFLDADSATIAYIDTWYDQSGNAYNITQTTLTDQPQLVASAFATSGSVWSVRFDGVSTHLIHDAGANDFCSINQYVSFTALKVTGNSFACLACVNSNVTTSQNSHWKILRYNGVTRHYWNNGSAQSTAIATPSIEQYLGYKATTNLQGYIIDDSVTNTNTATATNDGRYFLMGCSSNAGSHPFGGDVGEFLWFDDYLTSDNRDTFVADQNDTYTLF